MCVMYTKKNNKKQQPGIGANFETPQNIIFAKVVVVHWETLTGVTKLVSCQLYACQIVFVQIPLSPSFAAVTWKEWG